MRKSILVAMILMCSVASAKAADIVACPVDSATVDTSYGRYASGNTIQKLTGTIFRNIVTQNVKAVQDGVVISVLSYDNSGGNFFVGIKHADGTFSQYHHVATVLVPVGAYVGAGQQIGTIALNPCGTTFVFSTTTKNMNTSQAMLVTGYKVFPDVFVDATAALKAVCK